MKGKKRGGKGGGGRALEERNEGHSPDGYKYDIRYRMSCAWGNSHEA